MIVRYLDWQHTLSLQEPIFWRLRAKGPDGYFWHETPFTLSRRVDGGTELDNLKKLFLGMRRMIGTDVTELSVPETARAILWDSLDQDGNPRKHYHLWGTLVRFTPAPSNDVTLRGRGGITLTVPWE
jgi:hypothetical protein